jgi:hypothetical protein
MCRWMAYSGEPILAEELLFRPTHSRVSPRRALGSHYLVGTLI